MNLAKEYYYLLKPGIVRGNLITALAGFLLAARGDIEPRRLLLILVGLYLTMGSGCVLNNIIDRDIDSKMDRTKNRALVTGTISVRQALIFTVLLMVSGSLLLLLNANIATLIAGFIGWFFYIVLYSLYTKRQTVWGTVVGSVSGATPPVAGYLAYSGRLDIGVVLLFLSLVFWQLPHFYAIAIKQQKDYKNAGINVMPVVYGLKSTKVQSIFYIFGFALTCIAMFLADLTGVVFLGIMLALSAWWMSAAAKELNVKNQVKWGLKVFRISLVVLLTWSLLLMFDNLLP